MAWNPRNTDQLITGLVGITGTLLGTLMSSAGSRFWNWWDTRQYLKKEVRRIRLQFEYTESKSVLADSLKELKAFMIQNDSMFARPHLKQFFDLWLMDEMLDGPEGQHSKLLPMACVPEIKELKADASRLLRW
jgi:hypothetical protein